ncbi:MAG: DsbE family thiol:disulfide interchange protein [Betaproteobacteria bacterium]|nr:DsbE family thiol:disulfide interchange protein [Betaproteobacteria bacterium]
MLRFGLPLGVFLALVVLLAIGLNLNPREVPSPLINKPAPAFELPQLHALDRTFSPKSVAGQVWMLNVWASWCAACREEHPLLVDLAKNGVVPLYGLNYKDRREDAVAWLKRFGDPYRLSIHDFEGKVGIDYGVYGVPETYIIDKSGVIRYKRIGPITPDIVQQKILPLVKELNGNA